MVQRAPRALHLDKPLVCKAFMQNPGLLRYNSITELADKYHPLQATFAGLPTKEICLRFVRWAGNRLLAGAVKAICVAAINLLPTEGFGKMHFLE
jgi:hypothetical protein